MTVAITSYREGYDAGRKAGLEEAARVAESSNDWPQEGADIAAAIRALADGPLDPTKITREDAPK